MRVALFGGTFDPPHNGHIAIAKAAANTFALDRILFAPTGLQPLKLDRVLSPFALRLALASAACEEDPRFSVTDIDSPHPDGSPNYTVDTLAKLKALDPSHTLFNLVGADALLSLWQWRGSERILDLAEWIVATRPGYDLSEQDLAPLALTPAQCARIHILSGIAEDVSATALRKRLYNGDVCADLIPKPVAAYIAGHRIYC